MSSIGNLTWVKNGKWLESQEKITVPVFETAMNVRVRAEEEDLSGKQREALAQLLTTSPNQRLELTHYLALDCQKAGVQAKIAGVNTEIVLNKRNDVWGLVRWDGIKIPKHGDSQDRYVFVSGSCQWDKEHGIEFLFKNGRVFLVGRQDGLIVSAEWRLWYINE